MSDLSDLEGGEFEEDGNRENEDEEPAANDDEDQTDAKRVEPPKRKVIRNPQPKLNTERLKGPKGLATIEKYFEGFKFHGDKYEKFDLDRIMKRLEHWSYRLFPKLQFDDFLGRLEKLGSKKELQVYLKKYRLDMLTEDMVLPNSDEEDGEPKNDFPDDEITMMVNEQLEKQKVAEASRAANSSRSENLFDSLVNAGIREEPSTETETETKVELTEELRAKIERNRQLALERRAAKRMKLEEESTGND